MKLSNAADALGAVDLREVNDRHEALTRELDEVRTAAQRAEVRLSEIGASLAADADESAGAVADALIAGVAANVAADLEPNRQGLLAERDTLRTAISSLRERERKIRVQITDTEDEAGQIVRAALAGVSNALRDEAQAAASKLLTCFANATALEDAIRGNAGLVLACRQAAEGLAGSTNLLDFKRYVEVSPEFIDLHRAVQTLGPAMPKRSQRLQIPAP